MIPGLNSKIRHAGVEYQVQTEDLGRQNRCVLTLVFHAGAVVARQKVNHLEALGEGATEAQIKRFMEEQHHRIIQSLLASQIQGDAVARALEEPPLGTTLLPPPASPAADDNLDQLIDEYVRNRKATQPH
jgi:hypothetical protein